MGPFGLKKVAQLGPFRRSRPVRLLQGPRRVQTRNGGKAVAFRVLLLLLFRFGGWGRVIVVVIVEVWWRLMFQIGVRRQGGGVLLVQMGSDRGFLEHLCHEHHAIHGIGAVQFGLHIEQDIRVGQRLLRFILIVVVVGSGGKMIIIGMLLVQGFQVFGRFNERGFDQGCRTRNDAVSYFGRCRCIYSSFFGNDEGLAGGCRCFGLQHGLLFLGLQPLQHLLGFLFVIGHLVGNDATVRRFGR
mmetsp:Transcript_15177/g.33204  ORF Transcript_15177/g.33204 Transcript_15177/m.33204 type:complete len:242 (-) Transcript_15177:219-944(-)